MRNSEHSKGGSSLHSTKDAPIKKASAGLTKKLKKALEDKAAADKANLNSLYNFAWSLFDVIKDFKYKEKNIAFANQCLFYLSEIIGNIAELYQKQATQAPKKDDQAFLQNEAALTLKFQKEVKIEIESQLGYYAPEVCGRAHDIEEQVKAYGCEPKEIPARVTAIRKAFEQLGENIIRPLPSISLSIDNLVGIHDENHLQNLKSMRTNENVFEGADEKYPNVGMGDIMYEADTLDAIEGSLGAFMDAIKQVVAKPGQFFTVTRPPQHHAHHEHAEGFCFASSLVKGIKELIDQGKKAVIVDFDAHHGNGTYEQLQRLFKEDKKYQDNCHFIDVFSANSYITDNPTQEDVPENLKKNIHLFPMKHKYSGAELLEKIQTGFQEVENEGFKDYVIVASAGFDTLKEDNYGGILSPKDFGPIGAELRKHSDSIVSVLEGGYKLKPLSQAASHYVTGVGGLLFPDSNTPEPQPNNAAVIKGLNFLHDKIGSTAQGSQHSTASSMRSGQPADKSNFAPI